MIILRDKAQEFLKDIIDIVILVCVPAMALLFFYTNKLYNYF